MADKEYEINIKTTSDLQGVTSVKEALTETKEEADEVSSSMEDVGNAVSDVDSTPIDDLNSSTSETADTTNEATDSTDQLGVSITNIDSSVIEQLRDSMSEYQQSAQDSADSTNDLMEGLVSGGVATGLAGTFMGLADSAGSYNDSMLRMGLALNGHAMTVEEVSQKYGASVSKMADTTGRSAGNVRTHFTNMAVAGVTSSKELEESFQAVANGSFYSGESIEQVSGKFQRLVMMGTAGRKQLASLGLSMEDLASVMGVSADEVSEKFKSMSAEERASVLSTASANKYGTDVNGVFKNSWEGLWVQMDKAKESLQRLTGELILPYLIPAVQTATGFLQGMANVFKSLPAPVKSVLGGIMLLMGGVTTLGLGLNAVMKIGKLVFAPFNTIAKLFGVDLLGATKNLATSFLDLGKKTLIAGYNALKSAGMWLVNKAQLVASSIASGLATIKNWALAISEWAVASPILIVIAVIVALIAVLGYLYFNNEQVKNAVDGLGQAFYNIGTIIYGYLVQAFNIIVTTLQNVWNYITTLGGLIPQGVNVTGNQVIDGILAVMMFIATLPLQLAMIFTNMIAKALGFGDNFVQNLMSAGTRAVTNFMNSIASLPSRLATELNNMLSKVSEWASTLPQKFWDAGVNAVKNFLSALGIASPGTMQRMLIWEITEMGNRIPKESRNLLTNVSNLGENIVDEFGNPSLNVGASLDTIGGSDDRNQNQVTQNFYLEIGSVDSEDRVKEIVDVIRRELAWNNRTAGRTI